MVGKAVTTHHGARKEVGGSGLLARRAFGNPRQLIDQMLELLELDLSAAVLSVILQSAPDPKKLPLVRPSLRKSVKLVSPSQGVSLYRCLSQLRCAGFSLSARKPSWMHLEQRRAGKHRLHCPGACYRQLAKEI